MYKLALRALKAVCEYREMKTSLRGSEVNRGKRKRNTYTHLILHYLKGDPVTTTIDNYHPLSPSLPLSLPLSPSYHVYACFGSRDSE